MTEPARILIVDDDRLIRRAQSRLLKRAGYDVLLAKTGDEAIRIVEESQPDVVLLDVVLPDLDGRDICRRIKADPTLKETFIVLLSGMKTSSSDQADGLTSGADGYIARPISNREMLARVQAFLRLRRAQEAAQQEHQLMTRIVETTPVAITIVNRNGQITFANSYAEQILGLSKKELTQRTYDDPAWRITALDGSAFPEEELPFQRVLATGQPVRDVRHAIEWPDGKRKFLSINGAPLLDQQGAVERVVFAIEDITVRRRAEEALRESEENYRHLVEEAPIGIFRTVSTGAVVDINTNMARMLGYKEKEDALEHYTDLGQQLYVDPHRRQEFLDALEQKGKVERFEYQARRRDGSPIWISMTARISHREPDGTFVIDGFAVDITDRKRAEQALISERNLLYSLLDHIPDSIYFKDRQNRFLRVSRSKAKHVGVEKEDLIGKTDFDFYPRPQAEEMHQDDLEVMQTEEPIVGKVEKVTRPDGEERWVSVTKIPRYDESGELIGTLGISHDVTSLKDMEKELRQQERLAAVGQLAGGIAHDFNNILAAIVLYARLPLNQHPGLPADVTNALQTILEESNRAADLVQQILDFSRSAMLETSQLNLGAFVREIMAVLRRVIPESIHLRFELGSKTCHVQADPTRIQQMVMNLAVNARDAMPHGGELRIGVRCLSIEADEPTPVIGMPPGRWARLTVADTGVGMADEVRDHIFEPFFTTKEPGKGTGLGLSQVYGIVKQHDGYIDFETATGEGTTFYVYLPIIEDELCDERAAREPDATHRGAGETILLVEDATPLRHGMATVLESLGYRVLAAASGDEALHLVDALEGQVDLVITDLIMPGMNGQALLETLTREQPDLKSIAITGYAMESEVQAPGEIEFEAIVHKPFDMNDLAMIIDQILNPGSLEA